MRDETLLTLRQLAQELSLPESTVRYYRDAFLNHIPSVGTGRRRRYPRDAVAVLRQIAESYAAGRARLEIAAGLEQQPGAPHAGAMTVSEMTPQSRALEDVSNLDLLAAILDGEREQRDALWQLAKEIVRLTEVLEGQDKVLVEIADRAGVVVETRPAIAAASGAAAALRAGTTPSATPPAPEPIAVVQPSQGPPPVERAAASAAPVSDVERLRRELEAERALVERLRESKLQLEHRAASAEEALTETRERRTSVIGRLLRTDDR